MTSYPGATENAPDPLPIQVEAAGPPGEAGKGGGGHTLGEVAEESGDSEEQATEAGPRKSGRRRRAPD